MIKNLDAIEKVLGVEPGFLINASKSAEEVEIKIPELKIFKPDEFETFTTNLKKEDYENGKKAGVEMSVKEHREKLGLQFEGKTIDKLIEAVQKKTLEDAKIEPSKKIEDLTKDLDKLRNINTDLTNQIETIKNERNQEKTQLQINRAILSELPKTGIHESWTEERLLREFVLDWQPEMTDGQIVLKKDGQILKDQLMNPKKIKDVMSDWVKPFTKQNKGGAGDGDSGTDKKNSMESFNKEMESNKIGVGTPEYNKEMQKRIKDKTLVV
jgi:hypothetical protein